MTLFKKLATLANKLDKLGYTEESSEIDKILKHIIAFWGTKMPKCTCTCEECSYAKNLPGRAASKNHHKNCTTGQCEIKKALE
jgi:hypothetical protein